MNRTPAELRCAWNDVCQGYLEAFCRKHGYDYSVACVSWIGDIGQWVTIGDYAVDMETLRTDIDFEAPREAFLHWYDERLAAALNEDEDNVCPSYRVWLRFRADEAAGKEEK